MADWKAAEQRVEELKVQLDALEAKLQKVTAETPELVRAEVQRLMEEHGVTRCRGKWRAGVLSDPEHLRPADGARCTLPPHPKTTACTFQLENGELWSPF